ncbi:MAG TPA: superoxide dismutase [Candidatus Saccharimonadales bacterium]|nr:superoxide dismutase [Candidatus Saccharimonadales bacterium]
MFKLPDLGYSFDALEPYIDAKTMEIHHGKHHGAYVEKLNTALEKYPDWQNKTIEEILSGIKSVPEDIRTAVQNNGGGHANHRLFWQIMKPAGTKDHHGKLADALKATFGSLDGFKSKMTEAAINRFGSGWAWLVKNGDKLEVYSTANQDSPLMEGKTPILGLDVWEHAYYLKYQNRRPEYIEAWWNVVNWDSVAERLNT